jgi:hypothetical protein
MVKLVLPKSSGFARYRRFGVFGLHGHFDLVMVFFWGFGSDLPAYTYDLRTTLVVRGAGGCLTTKKGPWCGAVLVRCGAVFVDLFHFLLLFLLLVIFINYFLLLKQG